MSYWEWLKIVMKLAASMERIKNVLTSSALEFVGGFVMAGFSIIFAIGLGIIDNCLYYLLFLGLIPSILMMLHSEYRDQMRWRER